MCSRGTQRLMAPNVISVKDLVSNREHQLAGCAFLFLFTAYLSLLYFFYQLRLLDGWDVIFDSDPIRIIKSTAHGWDQRSIVHPHIDNFFAPFLRMAGKVLFSFGLIEDEFHFRNFAAMVVVPLFSAAKIIGVYYLLRLLEFSWKRAAYFTVFLAVSWAQILFAGLPDTFALSSFVIVVLMLYAALVLKGVCADKNAVWMTIGFVLGGITVTNMAVFGLVLWQVRCANNNWTIMQGFMNAAFVTVMTFLVTVGTSMLIVFALGDELAPYLVGGRFTYESFLVYQNFFQEFVGYPAQIGLTFVGLVPDIIDNVMIIRAENHPLIIRFTYETVERSWQGLVLGAISLSLIAGGFTAFAKRNPVQKCVMGISLSVVLFNAVLHGIIGEETYLYSPHWQVSAFILLVMGAQKMVPETMPLMVQRGLGVSALFVVFGMNFAAFYYMVSVIETYL